MTPSMRMVAFPVRAAKGSLAASLDASMLAPAVRHPRKSDQPLRPDSSPARPSQRTPLRWSMTPPLVSMSALASDTPSNSRRLFCFAPSR